MTDEQWTWDESLFAGSAPYYVRGRLPYALGVPEALASALALDGRGRLIDVGCGPGIIALLLAHLFEQVVGINPDAGMLEEAARRAAEQQATNVRWVRMRAEELPAGLGTFRVATFSRSFHWMDRDRVAGLIRDMLEPGGAFVLVSERHAVVEGGRPAPDEDGVALPHPAPPFAELNALVRGYLGPKRRAGQSVRTTSPGDEEAVLARAGFEAPESIWVTGGEIVERDADDVLAHYYSRSSSAPHLFGDRLRAVRREARAILASAATDGCSPSGRRIRSCGSGVEPNPRPLPWREGEKVLRYGTRTRRCCCGPRTKARAYNLPLASARRAFVGDAVIPVRRLAASAREVRRRIHSGGFDRFALFRRVHVAEEDEEQHGVHAVEDRRDLERQRQTGMVEEIAGDRRAGC